MRETKKTLQRVKTAKNDKLSKFQRYRQAKARRGMKLLRMWVPDTNSPEFIREAKRQGALLKKCPSEKEVTKFIEAAFEWPPG